MTRSLAEAVVREFPRFLLLGALLFAAFIAGRIVGPERRVIMVPVPVYQTPYYPMPSLPAYLPPLTTERKI